MLPTEIETLHNLALGRHACVEVGTWVGMSAMVILDAMADDGHLLMVDTFAGSSGGPLIEEMPRDAQLAMLFENIGATPKRHSVAITRSEWIAPLIADASLDFVFIDAAHDLDSVTRDLALWTPKVAPGGMICGHDFECAADAFEPGYLVAHQNEDYDPVTKTHPGVILAVTAAFGAVEHENRIWWKPI